MKRISYEISLSCEIDKYDNVIPMGLHCGVKSSGGKDIAMNNLPRLEDVLIVWLGKYYSYPKTKGEIKELK